MNSKNLLIIVALIVLAGGYYLFKSGKLSSTTTNTVSPSNQAVVSESPTNGAVVKDNSAVNEATVKYTDSGFTPDTVTIKAGGKVTWTNSGSANMWVASAPHPQHTDYPGFDALKGSASGESYSFTFTKTGTWKYHNHLNPRHFGKVVVE